MSIQVTESAAKRIATSAEQSGMQGLPLRIAAKRRSDGSIEYAMGFDEVNESDAVLEYHNVKVVVAPTSTELLSNATLDYVEMEPDKYEFIFLNPNDPNYVPPKES